MIGRAVAVVAALGVAAPSWGAVLCFKKQTRVVKLHNEKCRPGAPRVPLAPGGSGAFADRPFHLAVLCPTG
jgi:hypothetical protein